VITARAAATFEPVGRSVAAARAFVRDTLQGWGLGDIVDDAVVLTSELVTNAVVHAETRVRLRVEPTAHGVRIRVHDQAAQRDIELREPPSIDSPSGRGLLIVSRVADRWGVEATRTGKEVWFELTAVGVNERWS
jgi:anti-sigma regulatory factor (Ser/Thr protein kinase)